MTARNFRFGPVLAVLITATLAAAAQEISVDTPQRDAGQHARNRNKEKEDKVAKLLEDLRAKAKIHRLKRIGHRASLEQEVCTIALTGTPPKYASTNESVFYKTANPAIASPELTRVASFNDPSFARYSVAVWPIENSTSGEQVYWVGVQLFWSAGTEFFDYHFTDDIYYHDRWKKSIAAQCRGK